MLTTRTGSATLADDQSGEVTTSSPEVLEGHDRCPAAVGCFLAAAVSR